VGGADIEPRVRSGVETNAWNRIRYTFWAPLYDLVGRRFDGRRRRSLGLLDLAPGERVLIVGAGTGADLPYVPAGCVTVATDLTPAMLRRARPQLREGMHLGIMDGQGLGVLSGSCDAVVLHLILAVIPDPVRCLREAARVLRPGGRIAVFDKFSRAERPSPVLRLVNVVTRTLFTDVTRRFEDILERSGADLAVEVDEPALFRGLFRHLLLRKAGAVSSSGGTARS
jgi:phosphatidylethanolamine/phosphatidyl-N-methylethanolamine N-methyltransferase